MKYGLILPLFLLSICEVLCADTILLKDGQGLKGVVVEDYHDRVVFSTEKGEICLLKNDIEKIAYDITEENLVKLGAFYKDKGDYKLALYYYEAAYKLNPNMKEAQEGTLLVTNTMFRKGESDLEKEVTLRQDTEEKMGRPASKETKEPEPQAAEVKGLSDTVGISIENIGQAIKVNKVLRKSPADEAGIKEGDVIISIWGKLIKYTPLKDVYGLFLNNNISEFRVTVSRDKSIVLRRNHIFGSAEDMIGARLTMEFEGLVVSELKPGGPLESAGVLKGDRIARLAGNPTRYMPLATVYKLIEDINGNSLDLEIQREIIFWKR